MPPISLTSLSPVPFFRRRLRRPVPANAGGLRRRGGYQSLPLLALYMIHRIDSSIPSSCGCPHRIYPSRVSVRSTSSSPAMLRRLGPVVFVFCRALSCCSAS
ncbi:hypothetical protein VPH35_066415 [Triticum aestivum]|uniref:Uncharacterized protein n=1 Tax=Triticum urartu TaxID=4572 RepID=A0A8R7Q4A0_TRIUA